MSDYPNEPIGDGSPYWRCVSCKRSDPEINGRIEGHLNSCAWRKRQEAKHTPGPWHFDRDELAVYPDDGGTSWDRICDFDDGHTAYEEPEATANLLLIAAAPDLLAAARAAEKYLSDIETTTQPSQRGPVFLGALRLVRAAIAKAEGLS